MPHLVLEYSGNVRDSFDPTAVLAEIHTVLSAAGGFRPQDFKSRAVRLDTYAVGDGSREQSFANLDVRTRAALPAPRRRRCRASPRSGLAGVLAGLEGQARSEVVHDAVGGRLRDAEERDQLAQ